MPTLSTKIEPISAMLARLRLTSNDHDPPGLVERYRSYWSAVDDLTMQNRLPVAGLRSTSVLPGNWNGVLDVVEAIDAIRPPYAVRTSEMAPLDQSPPVNCRSVPAPV